jgi:hypothetical protein
MFADKIRSFIVALLTLCTLSFGASAWALTNAELAAQVRSQWATAQKGYQEAIKPYAGTALAVQYTDTLTKTGTLLEQYITLKLAAAPATQITPVVDQLVKNLGLLRTLQGKATGDMLTVLGTALTQHNLATQNALKNMR